MPMWLSAMSAQATRQSDSRCCRLCAKFDKSIGTFSDSFDLLVGERGYCTRLRIHIERPHDPEYPSAWQAHLDRELPERACQWHEHASARTIEEADFGAQIAIGLAACVLRQY